MNENEKNVLRYYSTAIKLKDLERKGWKDWHIKRNRTESDAEHIYGTQQLALAMWSEFNYDINIERVLAMLAVHETEEIDIGDNTPYDMTKEEKARLGSIADDRICGLLKKGNYVRELIREFDERKTKEAQFAYFCDKLECDIQCKIYDEEGCFDIKHQEGNSAAQVPSVKEKLSHVNSLSELWMSIGRERYSYDEPFNSTSKYAQENRVKLDEN